jgi:hypothetical protein
MGSLLLEKDLRKSKEDSEVRTLARARTLTVLGRLDPSRKAAVTEFLVEADLVQRVEGRKPIIRLESADLSGAVLSDPDQVSPGCGLSCYDPGQVTNLRGADLAFANLTNAQMYMVDLKDANLSDADLSSAFLKDANLSGADLSSADLSDADLTRADLSHAKGMSTEELEQETSSLGSAIMPDGQRHKSIMTEFVTTEFEPALSFSRSEEWEITEEKNSVSLYIFAPEGGYLDFTNPLHVFDPSDPSAPKGLPTPENAEEWLSWFQRHPNLDISKPVPASVGDASGKRIDVTVTSTPENYPKYLCYGGPCVPLYPLSESKVQDFRQVLRRGEATSWIAVSEGYKHRFVIVDVQGETVLIDASAPTDKFDDFSPKAQKVLDSVEWKSE